MVRESILMKIRLTMGLEVKVSPGYKSEVLETPSKETAMGERGEVETPSV